MVKNKGYIYGNNPLRKRGYGWPETGVDRPHRHRNIPSRYWLVMLAFLAVVLAMGLYAAGQTGADVRSMPSAGTLDRPAAIPSSLRR